VRYEPERHHRRSVRLRQYDYAQAGAYFVTICVQGRECLLGEVVSAAVVLSPFGRMADNWWNDLPRRFPDLDLDGWVVMPNHMHGIVVLSEPVAQTTNGEPLTVEGRETPPLPVRPAVGAGSPRPRRRPTLGQVVAYFKYQSTKSVNQARSTPGGRFWQRSYYDHIIRDEASLDRLRNYVVENPLRWELDQLHPDQPSKW
jgi:putative transposase